MREVEGRETEDSSSELSIRHIDPYKACPFQSDVNDDANVPMEAYEYVDDICAFYKLKEKSMCIKPNLIARLKHGFGKKSRAFFVEWLIEAREVFEFPTEAMYLAIHLFDRFLALSSSGKEERDFGWSDRPTIGCQICWNKRVHSLCPFVFLLGAYFMPFVLRRANSRNGVLDVADLRYETCTFRPSILTAAAIYTAHATVRRCKPCSKIYEQLTGCNVGQIWKCSRLMVTSHIKARSVKSVYKKYNTRRYNWVAKAIFS
ncbi:cyclin-B2-3-like [Eucalyptus grandis]|uniref:cyclin-B2-3-like n=1 Tax=Eucalyptus grandis TaxID=71139 RepID=UPI00192EBBD0|nr:cyclin-B2-3-like [Eucalyptus grandis]